jgi:hypothetical protein
MHVQTTRGTDLFISLTAEERIIGGHPESIIEFRYFGGMLCTSYYVSTFIDHATKNSGLDGLMLESSKFIDEQVIDAPTVQACAKFINERLA